jgi:GT2 family glycosyltransferase
VNVSLVVLSRYEDLFDAFAENVQQFEPEVDKILVRDGEFITLPPKWRVIQGREPFNFSANVNAGWRMAGTNDVLLSGDDVRFTSPFISRMQEIAYSDPKIGFVVPELGGQSCFVCAYIKRELIDIVGPMDERFTGYGADDNDYYRRFESFGYRTQPTTDIVCTHEGGTSFYRREKEPNQPSVGELNERNWKLYEEKWREF